MSVESGADRLVKAARFAQYHQSYRLDHLSADQWIHLYYMKRGANLREEYDRAMRELGVTS